jgi:pilus assembly protein CpaF
VDARLPNGIRVHAVLGCLALPGTCISLRVPAKRSFSLQDCIASGSLSLGAAQLLTRMIEAKLAFLISGGTGSGKTTLLAALLALVPQHERIVIVEDSRELAPNHPHVVRIEGRPANTELAGAISLTALVRQSLRMRPDRLVVGEVRGGEICDLLTAMNTGHEGGCGTVHANSTADVPARLEALASLGGLPRNALHAQLASALDAVIHVTRDAAGLRRVAEISIFACDSSSGLVRSECAIEFLADGRIERGPGSKRLERMLNR